jgi:hypothetical protein
VSDTPQDAVDAEIAGQKFSIKSASLGTIATVLTLIVVVLIAWTLWLHGAEAKDTGKSLVEAINAMTKAQMDTVAAHRETNCLIGYQGPPTDKVEFCKRISR